MTSVYDAMRIMGKDGVDVYDDIYDDEGACWDVWDDGPRAEGAVYRYVMEHVAFVRGVESQHGVHFLAEVSRFVEGNMDVLGPFSKVWNDSWYLVDGSDDGIESGISTVHCIMAGGYPEEAYEELAEAWGVARMDIVFTGKTKHRGDVVGIIGWRGNEPTSNSITLFIHYLCGAHAKVSIDLKAAEDITKNLMEATAAIRKDRGDGEADDTTSEAEPQTRAQDTPKRAAAPRPEWRMRQTGAKRGGSPAPSTKRLTASAWTGGSRAAQGQTGARRMRGARHQLKEDRACA